MKKVDDGFYKTIIEESPAGYAYHKIICDDEGIPYDYKFIEVNSAFEKFTGLKSMDIIDKRITEIIPNLSETETSMIKTYGEIAINGGNQEIKVFLPAIERWCRIKVYAPAKYYFITRITDISQEMAQVIELEKLGQIIKANEVQYRTIADYAYDWETWEDELGKLKYVSPSCARISGYTVAEFIENSDLFISIIIPEDKEIWFAHRHENVNNLGMHSEEFRIRNKAGQIVWLEHNCRPVINEDGLYLGYRANNRDITDRKLAEEALRMSEEKYRLLTEHTSDVIWVFNTAKFKFTYISPAVFYLRGVTVEEAMDERLEDIFTPESLEFVLNSISKNTNDFIENRQTHNDYSYEVQQNCKNGNIIWVEVSSKFRYNADGDIEIVGRSRNVGERKKTEEQVLFLSYHDQLTGLYNRRFYEEELKRLDIESNLPITLVMTDVNGLKLTNDAFGHLAGDKLIQSFAEILRRESRVSDIVARTGGDEFVILLPKTDSVQAAHIVKRIKLAIAKAKPGKTILSVSCGFATKIKKDEDFDKIYMQAENHMYRKKLLESASMKSKTIKLITKSLYEKNESEQRHCERVRDLCQDLGTELGLSLDVIDELGLLGLLHDIGKTGISEKILNKPGKLDELEWTEVRRHPEIGYQILKSVKEFAHIAEYVLTHHERNDGSGYPRSLKEAQIPLHSKILSIAEAYDAMTNDNTYSKTLSVSEAINELKINSTSKFDAEIVKIFVEKVLCEKME